MNETVASMNGTLWVFAAMLIAMVLIQAAIFLRLALNFNKKNNLLSGDEIKSAIRTGTVSVVGPAFSVIVIGLTLIAMVGPAVTFMRCGVIGAPGWELLMANTAADAVGVKFNTPEFTQSVFVLCIFGMTFASAPYFINTIITLKPLDMAILRGQKNQAAKKKKYPFVPMLAQAAMMGIIGNSLPGYMRTLPSIVAVLVSAAVAFCIVRIIAKTGKRWLGDWNIAISMIFGMVVGQMLVTYLPK